MLLEVDVKSSEETKLLRSRGTEIAISQGALVVENQRIRFQRNYQVGEQH